MALPPAASKSIPVAPIVVSSIVVLGLIAALFYLNKPTAKSSEDEPASPEAKAYVSNLALSNVSMRATDNFMKQQVVEIQGNIANKGSRPLKAVDVYCLFYGIDGHEIYRERLPIVQSKGSPLKPNETRPFRLPFDSLPDGWNQTMPKMVIAQIAFAD